MPKRRSEVTQEEMLAWLKEHAKVSGPTNTAIVDPETGRVHKLAMTVAEVQVGDRTYTSSLSSGHGTHEQPGMDEYATTLTRIVLYTLLDRTRAVLAQEMVNGEDSAAD